MIHLGIGDLLVRSLGVGVIYALVNTLLAGLLGPMSRLPATWEYAAMSTLSGAMIGLSLAPIILRAPWSRRKAVFLLWTALAMVGPIGLSIEGFLFKPTPPVNALVNGVKGIAVQLVTAWSAVALWGTSSAERVRNQAISTSRKHGRLGWALRLLVAGLSYFVFYFVFGGINYMAYTRAFYEMNPAFGLSRPPAGVIFTVDGSRRRPPGRGDRENTKREVALWVGGFLFVVGGLAPYVEVVFRTMPMGFNLATLTEILFQNFLTGVVVAYLFGPGETTQLRKGVAQD